MHGLGRKMPLVFLSFTLAGLSLLGVPPLPGFVSKYALVTAAFSQGSALALCGAVALLAAAVLTAVYIFTVVYPAFFMELHQEPGEKRITDPGPCMGVSLLALCALLMLAGVFAGRIMAYLTGLAGGGIS
jgi:multicomponent Na+:H+ antiporter subunit D